MSRSTPLTKKKKYPTKFNVTGAIPILSVDGFLPLPVGRVNSRGKGRSRSTRLKTIEEAMKADARQRVQVVRKHVFNDCLVFKYDGLDITELAKTSSTATTKQNAQKLMEDWERKEDGLIPWTTIHLDRNRTVLLAYYGYRIKGMKCKDLKRTFKSSEEFQAWVNAEGYRDRLMDDGLNQTTLHNFQLHTQLIIAAIGITQCADVVRHTNELHQRHAQQYYNEDYTQLRYHSRVQPHHSTTTGTHRFEYLQDLYTGPPPTLNRTEKAEEYESPVGTLHLFLNWMQQGHTKKPSMSREKWGPSVNGHGGLRWYELIENHVQSELYEKTFAAFPEKARDYRHAHRVSSLETGLARHLFTGHVIVHNHVVHQHRDANDGDLCVTIPHGKYTGGHLYLPSLGVAHMYPPGSIAIFCSKTLYHGVTTWKPVGDVDEYGIPPGRTSHVFTTHQAVIDWCKDKEEGYCRRTGGGYLPLTNEDVQPPLDPSFPPTFDKQALFKRAINRYPSPLR
ncbi:hypothetical protein FRC14_007958 [Serendipita sp. 396]|nr:hypothetical protein FRC14_007958 [Serendipita sp. 396]KAG8783788.1 hypothetical protein FRC15_004548 [Serendipita sp. 397]KAG8793335.1 hypothetical protein FRC16_011007 [Serendipita sp. 398]KAG8867687.1 hypothetical protein FRC20_005148 [Serendipita sp. 405]